MTDQLTDIPTDQIDASALPRDRGIHDGEAQHELEMSILSGGLRQPIEVWQLSEPRDQHRYGLISGFRRLTAVRALGHDTISAFLRSPRDVPAALAAMVSENEIRAQISPWEKGLLILDCMRSGLFETPDAAIDALYPVLSRQKRTRLRSIVMVVEVFDGALATPERLSIARIERLASALRAGWEDLLLMALRGVRARNLASQWSALEPVITEALNPRDGEAAPSSPGAPRRSLTLKQGLVIRRELTRSGWILRFSGPEAKSPGLMDQVMDEVERLFRPYE